MGKSLEIGNKSLLDHETRMWKQRSRILWLSKRDGNTKYFHTRASHRFKKNSLRGIYNSNNVWTKNMEEVVGVITDFYQELFTTSSLNLSSVVLDQIPRVITDEMNNQMMKEFSVEEVFATLK